jgi:hypothetical protein
MIRLPLISAVLFTLLAMAVPRNAVGAEREAKGKLVIRPGLYLPLKEPPCSYCSTEHRKGFVQDDDLVLAWIRGAHNGGAIPVRHFLAGPRVINDTYGLFFYDPDGGYVAAYKKDYGYKFYGWRGGVMIAQGPDGTLWSALTGVAFEGPKKGQRLTRIPSLTSQWGYWRMLHSESTAYNLYDGKKYKVTELPRGMSKEATLSIGSVDPRLREDVPVLGVETPAGVKAYPLDRRVERACLTDEIVGQPVAVFWYAATNSATAFDPTVDGRRLTFYADANSPETAPFKDKETGTRWTIAGRAVDGPLRGNELMWIPSIASRWYAWSNEYPLTAVYEASK